MKNVFKIYKEDLVKIFTNYAALIVVIALCILPSLYAWFNIKASWDPYGEAATSGIKIGVVNNDLGTTLNGKEINIGNTVIDELKENTTLGWQFGTEEEISKAVEEGKYYASITIPENFSEDLTSIINEDIRKGEILYTVNEKVNAIAPKITDKGATSVQDKVSKAVVETVSEAIFGVANEVGIELENQVPKISSIYNSLVEVQGKFDDINEVADLAYESAFKMESLITDIKAEIPAIQKTLQEAQNLSVSVEEFLVNSKNGVDKIAPIIKQDIKIINEIATEVDGYVDTVVEIINSGSENAPEMIELLINKVSAAQEMLESLINILETFNKINPNKPFTPIIQQLTDVNVKLDKALETLQTLKENIEAGVEPDLTILKNVQAVCNDIINITNDIYDNFDTEILAPLDNIFEQGYTVAEGALAILKDAENKLPEVESILNTAYEGLGKGIEGIEYAKEKLPRLEAIVDELVEKIGKINSSDDISDIIDLLKSDVVSRSDFLSNPVEISENKLFTMNNYGSAMSPFYSVLSLWVGLLLLVSILTVSSHGEYKPIEVYFGKLLLFLTIAIIQGAIVSLGDLFILKQYCSNPALFVGGCIFTSIVFTVIVYSLVAVAGNVGKVMGIILLVLQVAGSGGTFPIQMTPKFFQAINPFLPFTYAISFAREAIGGVVTSVLIKDIIILSIYLVVFLLIGILFKKPLNKLLEGFVESFNKSEIGGH